MKKAFFFISVPLFLFSCHKNKNTPVTCDSYSIGMTVGTNVTLVATNTNTGQVIRNYQNIIQVDNYYMGAMGVYDHIHNEYYLYGIVNATRPILYRLNANTGIDDTLGSPLLDTVITLNYLVCNSTTGNLYFLGKNYYTSVNYVYEITPNTTSFSQRLVCKIPNWGSYVSSPVVDESTGYIYFLASNSPGQGSEYSLIKVNIANGEASFVAYTGNYPISGLVYNTNDSMLYGLNVSNIPIKAYPYYSTIVSYISINPGTGTINTIVDSIGEYASSTTFDYCNNLYVFGYDGLEPSTGKLVKKFSSSAFWENAGIY